MNRVKIFWRRFDRSYKRMLARGLLPMTTFQARLALRKSAPLRILVDNTVLGHAITHETGWINTGTKLWGGKVPVETGYTARIPVYSASNDKRVYREVRYLAGIAHLAPANDPTPYVRRTRGGALSSTRGALSRIWLG